MLYIYILELESNKYYIGKTTNPEFRLDKHFDGGASVWTNKYKPIKLIELISNCDNFDEDKYTLKYMEKYGIDNVRGGSFCQITLGEENLNTINKMIKNSTSKDNLELPMDTKYNEYLKMFSNIEETNYEIGLLEKEFEYVKNLNYILDSINNGWKNILPSYNRQINETNNYIKNNNMCYHTNMKNQFLLQLRFNIKYNENEIDEIFDNFCFFVDNVTDKKFSKDIFANVKINDFILEIFNHIVNSLITNCRHHVQITKSNFNELISNKYIDLNIFEKINLYNNKVKLNKLCLFLMQIENEVKRIYKNHQVENIESYEFTINKKMEILTDKMIKFTEENSEL
jgi:hypothetical protein